MTGRPRVASSYEYLERYGHCVELGPHTFYFTLGPPTYALDFPGASEEVGWHCYHVVYETRACDHVPPCSWPHVVRDMAETWLHVNDPDYSGGRLPEWTNRRLFEEDEGR